MWDAPSVTEPINATVLVPASKSLTNRYLVLAALADGPCTIHNTLISRDSELMLDALAALGVGVERTVQDDQSTTVRLTPPAAAAGPRQGIVHIDCGLAGTVMRFVPALAAALGVSAHFDGDAGARVRPMRPVLDALAELGARIEYAGQPGFLPFTVHPQQLGQRPEVRIDASGSSQFISAMLLAGPALPGGLRLRAVDGAVASPEHIQMTVQSMNELGATVSTDPDARGWQVAEGRLPAFSVSVEPDLSNAGPFLAAALATAGTVRIPHWPRHTTQIGGRWRQILPAMGARVELGADAVLTVRGTGTIGGIDYADAAELTPTLAALCTLADSPSRLTGIGHLRGHETDRLAALERELTRVGATVQATEDTLRIIPPATRRAADMLSYEDHRMATAAALIGLVTPGTRVENIATTAKTMPDFARMWEAMAATAGTADAPAAGAPAPDTPSSSTAAGGSADAAAGGRA